MFRTGTPEDCERPEILFSEHMKTREIIAGYSEGYNREKVAGAYYF